MKKSTNINGKMKNHNKSLHWIYTPLRCVKTSEFRRSAKIIPQKFHFLILKEDSNDRGRCN